MRKLLRSLFCGLSLTLASACYAQTADELEKHVTYLASDELQGRYMASEGYAKAAEYVYDLCTEYGLRVVYQPVPTRFGSCKNVIAWIEGTNPDTVVVVGAHLDHVGTRGGRVYNGADDNASGSAAILGLAKRFSEGPKPRYTIVFQWYTGEERGFIGSKYYVENPLFPEDTPSIKSHVFMLNLDMVGRFREGKRRRFLCTLIPDIPDVLKELYEKYPYAKSITYRAAARSDQVVFNAAGIPVVFLHTGSHSDYHRPTDDADKINYVGMVKVCDYAFDLLNMVIGASEIPDYILWESLPVYKGRP